MNFKAIVLTVALVLSTGAVANAKFTKFPDGSDVPAWFNDAKKVDVNKLGKKYVITDHGVVRDSSVIQTEAIQKVIDLAAANGGGVVVIPEGVYLTGSLFFKPGTHLHLVKGARLKGSDSITNYQIIKTRLEGQTIDYFAALVNADNCNGFTITGEGTIDGNGHRFYDEFWLRRKVNRKCTNLEALRPRMVYISNSKDVTVNGVTMLNSGFWTNHLYNCERIKYVDVTILAPTDGYPKGPSTDAIDLDVCNDVLISGCYMNVNDDGVCLKGGKGTYVDTIPGNGPVARVIVDKCTFGKTNAGVTFGSEAWDCTNVIMKDCKFQDTYHVLLFKMRPDTPQQYRNVLIDGARGRVRCAIEVQTWTQFYDKVERDPMPASGVDNVVARNCDLECTRDFYRDRKTDDYTLKNFVFENITAVDPSDSFNTSNIENVVVKDVTINGVAY
ncbi:MAG: glycosyl hydrolase family 28 protein [Bacteroides sp.]|nr:glycosyl hydrolase family 28 protein [Lachnospiraceae bacterium]MCM1332277.1 glycosyl hydrolase family 28 protein [Bacteroides sp.]MCM1390507.1 glycosyl hydrolase family 28 protein [Bacteroides sp.]